MQSIPHTILVILTTNDEQKNIFQTVTTLSGQDEDIKCKGLKLLKPPLGIFCFTLHSTYMLTNTMAIG